MKRLVGLILLTGSLGLIMVVPSMAQDSLNMFSYTNVPGGLKDIWGYTDSSNREYALCCTGTGLKIVDVTNPFSPITITTVPATGSDLKDVKTYLNYAYCVQQGGDLMIVDLSLLPVTATHVASYNSPTYNSAHNIYINGQYAYITKNGSPPTDLRILDLANPLAPVEVGSFTHPTTVDAHDAWVNDTICFVSHLSAGFVVLNIADITNPVLIAQIDYPGSVNHNLWGDTSGNYLFTTDETGGGHLRVWDISDYGNIHEVASYESAPNRIIHNVFTVDNLLYISYYGDGVKVVDVTNPLIPVEVGWYDTFPQGAGPGGMGCWGVYPYFASGNIITSDISNGLHVLNFNGTLAGYITGNVTDGGTSNALEDVSISIIENGQGNSTDASGDYALGAVPGTYTLVFDKFSFTPDTQVVVLTSGNTEVVDVVLTPQAGADFVGSVADALCGSELEGVEVALASGVVPSALTGASGGYDLGFLPVATYTMTAGRFGFLPAETSYTVVAGPPSGVNFALSPGAFDEGEIDQAWELGVSSDNATTGIWERGNPTGSGPQPEDDHTVSGTDCYFTGDAPAGSSIGANDIDGGTTTLRSPRFSLLTYLEPTLSYWRWYSNNTGGNPNSDFWVVEISDDDGATWTTLENTAGTSQFWREFTFDLTSIVTSTDKMKIQFVGSDLGGGSVVEAAVDDIQIIESGTYGDFDGDHNVTAGDIIANVGYIFKSEFAPIPANRSDADGNCVHTAADIIYLVNHVFKSGPEPVAPCSCP